MASNDLVKIQTLANADPGMAIDLVNAYLAKHDTAAAHAVKAAIHFQQDEYGLAVPCFRRALLSNPRNETLSLGLFHSLWSLDQTEEAFAEMKRYFLVHGLDHKSESADEYRNIVREIDQPDV